MDLTKATATATAGSRLDDGLARGMELVLTPTVLGVVGFLADRWLGILPVLTIAFALFGVIGMGIRSYYRYDAQMKSQETAGPWARPVRVPAARRPETLLRDEPAGLPTGVRL
ncbi:MAG: hypothetical protein NVSMB12_17790 [Acidimicrobiales bacterium]